MRLMKIFGGLVLSVVIASSAYAAFPYAMTYTPSAGNTILADHINTSNNEHINNNIPESIDDYSTNAAEMQGLADPYPASSESLATTLDGEIQRLRYQVNEIRERFNPAGSQWYHDVGAIRSVYFRLEPGATPGTNINIDTSVLASLGYNEPSMTDATDLAASGSSGSFALSADGTEVTLDITENVIGALASSITVHDINSSSTTEMYTVVVDALSNDARIRIFKRGATGAVSWLTILDALDTCDVSICIVTDS